MKDMIQISIANSYSQETLMQENIPEKYINYFLFKFHYNILKISFLHSTNIYIYWQRSVFWVENS